MTNIELEGRLRSAAATYERLAPAAPELERRIFARIEVTPREDRPHPGRPGRRSWPIQLLAAAALIAFAVAVAFLVREARLFGEPQPVTTPTPYRIPSPPAVAASCSSVARQWAAPPPRPARMLNSTTGWAYGPMRTTDGGAHWLDVSPPSIPHRTNKNDEFFLDATHAWVAETASSSKACVDHVVTFRTADGGRTWQQAAPIPVRFSVPTDVIWTGPNNHSDLFSFVDAQHGWLLLGSGPVSATVADGVSPTWIGATWRVGDLYRTTDGGLHWSLVATNPGSAAACVPTALTGLHEAAISFSSPTTGWMVATCGLLVTHDGGVTWGKSATPTAPNAPVFFDQRNGLVFDGASLLVTSDGGASWSGRALPAGVLSVDFINPSDGSALAGGNPATIQCNLDNLVPCNGNFRLYHTADSGKTWVPGSSTSLMMPAPKFWPPSYLHFVDSMNGFLDPGGDPADTRFELSGLFKTTDGGHAWTKVDGIVQGQ